MIKSVFVVLGALNFLFLLRLGLFNRGVGHVVYFKCYRGIGRHENLEEEEKAIIEAANIPNQVPKVVASTILYFYYSQVI